MRRIGGGGLLLLLVPLAAAAGAGFDDDFTGLTLRADYYHSGTAGEERFALRRVRIEGPWPGSRTRPVDPTNLGKYRVELADAATGRLLYSRGFASIFGEWETTGEARAGGWNTIQEALRVPEPRRPARLRLLKRDSGASFAEVWSVEIDPGSRFVDRPPPPPHVVRTLFEHGDPAVKVDLLFLGDGYAADELDRLRDDVGRLAGALFSVEPFASRREDFNVRWIESPAALSGVTKPRAGVFRDSPLGARYNTFDSERYVLTLEGHTWRDVAAAAPYDAVLILVNERKYGGGGIFNLYSTAAARSAFAPYLVVHEFGHAFAGLADEYYTSPVAYEEPAGARVESWEPNVTALGDPARLKWRRRVEPGTPVPTPWSKQEFERRSRAFQARRARLRAEGAPEERLEELFVEERERLTALLAADKHASRVGAFEGAMYEARGLYRPAVDCVMFTRDEVGFCPVCREAVERAIDLYTK